MVALIRSPTATMLSAVLLMSTWIPKVVAHMEMLTPFPMHSQYDPAVPVADKDYNLKSPLNANGSNFPCRGYQNERPFSTKATYVAGSHYNMQIAGTVNHSGGSCQISISYDNAATFKVIQSMIGNCPIQTSYDFTVPTYAPSGEAILSWTWFNEVGNREMYQTCAWVEITGSSTSRRRLSRRDNTYTSMQSLPNIWRANIEGLSTCNTTEGIDPIFAHLGPVVIYGPGKSASDIVTEPDGDCDSPTPYGQRFQQASDMLAPGKFPSGGSTGGGASAGSSNATSVTVSTAATGTAPSSSSSTMTYFTTSISSRSSSVSKSPGTSTQSKHPAASTATANSTSTTSSPTSPSSKIAEANQVSTIYFAEEASSTMI